MSATLLSFHGDKAIKVKYVNRLKAHAKADELIQGKGWEDGKGCAVGCTLENYDHKQYEKELGIPEWAAHLYDRIFEGLPNKEAQKFAVDFLKAVPVGVNLEPVKWKMASFILKENIDRVLSLTIDEKLKKQVVDAVRGCLALQETAITTGIWDVSAARSAASAARSAASASAARSARSAAWSARSAESAAWSAESAAWSARSAESASAESAAWSAARSAESARSAAWSAARSAESARSARSAYQRYATELLRLLKESK